MTAFTIAPFSATVAHTVVEVDSTRGVLPLPIDLLRDSTGHISGQGACALAQGTFNPSTGACTDSHGNPNAAAAAFQTLDGFATTGAMLSPLSDLVQASTITSTRFVPSWPIIFRENTLSSMFQWHPSVRHFNCAPGNC